MRSAPAAHARSTPIAASTCDGSIAPLAQADAAEAQTPASSSRYSSASLSIPSNITCADPATLRRRRHGLADAGQRHRRARRRAGHAARRSRTISAARSASVAASASASGDDAGHVVRAAAPVALLAAADDATGRRPCPSRNDQDADALRSAELVGAQRQRVDERPQRTAGPASTPPARHRCAAAASGAGSRTTSDTAPISVIVPTSLFTAITLTTATSRPERPVERVEVDVAGGVDADDGAAVALDDVQHGVVLGRRADRTTASAADGSGDRRVVALGAAPREHDLAGPAADRPRPPGRATRRRHVGRRGRSGASRSGWRTAR